LDVKTTFLHGILEEKIIGYTYGSKAKTFTNGMQDIQKFIWLKTIFCGLVPTNYQVLNQNIWQCQRYQQKLFG